MQINSLPAIIQPTNELTASSKEPITSAVPDTAPDKEKSPKSNYDVSNMSLDELLDMVVDKFHNGELSEEDTLNFSCQIGTYQLFGGVPEGTKMDMVDYFQQQIDRMNNTPGSKGVEYVERSLDILKGLKARSEAQIPTSV